MGVNEKTINSIVFLVTLIKEIEYEKESEPDVDPDIDPDIDDTEPESVG